MITAKVGREVYKVDGLANRGGWFEKTWLVGIGCGFDIHRIVVEADNEQAVIDTLTDSSYGHLIKTDELCTACEAGEMDDCSCTYAGNAGERVDLDEIRILARCKVNYFAKKD
jgi:hypothetical protein